MYISVSNKNENYKHGFYKIIVAWGNTIVLALGSLRYHDLM